MASPDSEVTELLDAWSAGDPEALDALIPLVVDDLRRMAGAFLARGGPGHTLQPTALVHEAYLRLVGRRTVHWESRVQFFAYMAKVMRRLLVDHARHRRTAKQGGAAACVPFDEALGRAQRDGAAPPAAEVDLLALNESLERLAAVDPRQGRVVELRYFGGLTVEETAQALAVSPRTVKREWRTARLWLLHELSRP